MIWRGRGRFETRHLAVVGPIRVLASLVASVGADGYYDICDAAGD